MFHYWGLKSDPICIILPDANKKISNLGPTTPHTSVKEVKIWKIKLVDVLFFYILIMKELCFSLNMKHSWNITGQDTFDKSILDPEHCQSAINQSWAHTTTVATDRHRFNPKKLSLVTLPLRIRPKLIFNSEKQSFFVFSRVSCRVVTVATVKSHRIWELTNFM